MKIILMLFRKKESFWANGPFRARKWCDFVTLDPPEEKNIWLG